MELTLTLTEADLENLTDTVQDSITDRARNPAYVAELTELRNKLLKIKARHYRQNYPQD